MRPASHGAGDRLREVVAERGGALELLDNELFWTTPDDWREWTGESTGESDGEETEPDRRRGRERRQTLPTGELVPPRPPRDGRADGRRRAGRRRAGTTTSIRRRRRTAGNHPSRRGSTPTNSPARLTRGSASGSTRGTDSLDEFAWPVTREEAQTALDAFVRDRLPSFGRYEDAMVTDEPFLSHSLLSPAINLGLLDPREPVRAVEAAYTERGVEPGAYDPDEDPAASDSGTTLDAFGKEDPGDGADDRGPAPVPSTRSRDSSAGDRLAGVHPTRLPRGDAGAGGGQPTGPVAGAPAGLPRRRHGHAVSLRDGRSRPEVRLRPTSSG